ncbi:MAG TPA: CHASE domain-containing protein, partial [Kofleriaceae bacterium]|nr:CHASE domain-containing protein [Kofleriaceae bacterium]
MSTRPGWVNAVLTGAVYFAVGQAARLAISPGYATAVWPAAGVALIAATRWGWPALLGVLAGAFAVNVNNGPPALALALALGPAMQAWVGARLVREPLRPLVLLDRGRDVARFLLLAGPVSCVVAATWAHAVLFASGSLTGSALAFSWFTWWVGDAIGVIVVAPVLLVLFGEPRPLWRGRILTVALPMLVACAAVAFVFVLSSRSASARVEAELSTRAVVIAHAIEQRLDRYTDVVAATASFVAANPQLTRDQFATFATGAFGRDTDIKTLGWCPRVTPGERAGIEAAGRALDPSFAFRAITPDGLAPAPERATIFPLLYSEPPSSRLGVDMSSEQTRADAIALAEATGKPVATPPLLLLRGLRGFLVVAPVRARGSGNLTGVTVAGYSTAALLASATAELDTAGLRITITDVTGPEAVPLDGMPFEATDWSYDLSATGRVWRIGVARIAPVARSWDSWYVLAAGLAFVGVLGGVLLAITGGRMRIAATEARYRDLYENAPDLYVTITIGTGKIVECNAAAGRELGYERDELIGLSLFDMAAPDDRELLVRSVASLRETGILALPHVVLRRKHGGQFDASISATAIAADTELLAARVLVRDISDIVESERDHQFQVELGELLRASESIEALMARAAARISDYLGLAKCHFCEIDVEAGQVLLHQYTRGEHASKEVSPITAYEAVGLGPLLGGKHHVVDDAAVEPAFASVYEPAFAPRGLRAFIAIPLMREGVCCAYFAVVSD